MSSYTKNNQEKGFIQLFILIIILVALLIYFGINPKGIWENMLKPIVEFGFDLIIRLIGFLFDIAIWLIEKIRGVLGI